MNRRTKRRLIVLGLVGGMIVVAGIGGTTVRKLQRERLAEASLAEGLAAYEQGDYPLARRKLITHLRIKGPQAEALTALGDSQRYVVEPNGRHLVNARTYLEQAVLLDPENDDAREILLDVHIQLGNWQELAEVAGALLEGDPTNARYATSRIEAHLQRGASDEALEAAQEFVEAEEGSIESHLEMLRVYRRIDRNAREQREYLEQRVAPTHGGTTSYAVLRATVEADSGRWAEARRLLVAAAEAGPTDGTGARMLLEASEFIAASTGSWDLYEQSQTWLVRWLELEDIAPFLSEIAAGRAWRDRDPQAAIDHAVRALGTDPQNESVFAWGALAAIELGEDFSDRADELRRAFESSVTEETEARAEGWRLVFDAAERRAAGSPPDEQPLLPDASAQINLLGADAVAAYYDALADIDRLNTQDAVDRLVGLSQQPSWRRARFALMSLLVSVDRAQDALVVLLRDERLLEVSGSGPIHGEMFARLAETADPTDDRFDSAIDQLLKAQPESPVALSTAGRNALARGNDAFARELAQRLIEVDASLAATSAIRFAAGLQRVDPTLARAVVDRVAEMATHPAQVAAAATGLAILGNVQEARDFMQSRLAAAEDAAAPQWNFARIQLANAIADEQSLETLAGVSEANADDRQLHIEILNGSAIWSDLDRAGLVIARLREAQGETGNEWRIFEARRLLEIDDSIETASTANSLLSEVFATERGKQDTRALLLAADAFAVTGPVESELEALRNAADGNDPLAALPRLIDRLQSTGRSADAERRLLQFVDAGRVSIPLREVRMQLLRRQGMHEQAARDMAALAEEGLPVWVLRAGIESRPGGSVAPLSEAELAALRADLAPEDQVFAARLLARVGRFEDGLARLEALPEDSTAGSRALVIARFLGEQGRTDEALDGLIAAAEASNDPDLWQEAVTQLIGTGRLDEASALFDRALAANPDNEALEAFRSAIGGDLSPFERMARVAAAAAERQDASEAMVEIGAIAKKYVRGDMDLREAASKLDDVSGRRATFYSLWPLLITAYEQLGNVEAAEQRARAAVVALPDDYRPARDATEFFLNRQDYASAASMADEWRSRAPDAESRARSQIAQGMAEFFRGNLDRSIGLLLPHTDLMLADPIQNMTALQCLAEALTLGDRMAEAEPILERLVESDARLAEFMASMAAVAPHTPENTARGRAWLERVAPMLDDDMRGIVALASSWMSLFDGSQNAEFAQYAIDLAESARGTPEDSWQLRAILATALEAAGQYARAVETYEEAMELAGQPIAALLNNAAWLLTHRLDEHERAVSMARRAVALAESQSANTGNRAVFHHTLGMALMAMGEPGEALGVFDAGQRLSATPSLRLGRIEALVALGREDEARREFGRIRPNATWENRHRVRYEELRSVLGLG
ncbi:MAG: hypothetical protein RIE77_14650 [Phycisphaerales bacterium]|jgi:tetratricopeptide (TPR) repeat protein